MACVTASRRLESLDVLRGVAVAGMLLVHVSNAVEGSGLAFDRWQGTVEFLVRGKFHTIFALLFGISFALQFDRPSPGRSTTGRFLRRLGGLALIMLGLRALFGSSLLYYAVWGLPLVLLRRVSSGGLALAIVALLSLQSPTFAADLTYGSSIRAVADWVDPGRRGPYVLSLFLLGLIAVRSGLVHRPTAYRTFLIRVAAGGVVLAGVTGLHPGWLGVSYAAAVMLVLARQEIRASFSPFAAVGRTAFSNYALHLFIIHALFSPGALGWRLGWWMALPVTLGIFALQAGLSAWWLSRYDRGPVEWLWRTLTDGRFQPLPRVRPASTAASESI